MVNWCERFLIRNRKYHYIDIRFVVIWALGSDGIGSLLFVSVDSGAFFPKMNASIEFAIHNP